MQLEAAHRAQLASRLSRFLGQTIDGVVTAVPALTGVLLASVSDSMGDTYLIAGIAASIAYYFFADCLGEGQSYGKRLLGMYVVHEATGAPCTPAQSFVRNLLLAILGPIDWLFIFGSRHQRLGDLVARTLVVTRDRVAAPG
jgi:uncharacterized RDD family membrane protein YckC